MTRIDFYFNVDNKLGYLAELASTALSRQRRLFVFVPDESVAAKAEHAFSSHVPTAFLPHCRVHHALAEETPILIDWQGEQLLHDDVLVNLRSEYPPFFSRFKRLIEIVGKDDADREEARGRYRFYRDRGYEIHSHDITGD
jgi:DNA polymerase III subunit chi